MESRHGVSSNISLPDTQLNQLSTQVHHLQLHLHL